MSDAPVGVAVIGLGSWGPNIVRALERVPGARLVAVCDVDDRCLAEASARTGAAFDALSDPADVFARDDVRAVIISTTAATHFGVARQAIEAGKHCLVEKPLTLSADDAAELVALAERRGLTLMVGHLMLFHPAIEWIREFIAAGELGDVLYLYLQRLNLGTVRTDENAFWSLAPHDVSMALHLLGEIPDRVSASGCAFITPGVHDTVFANLHFESGRMANIHVSWLDPHKTRRLTVVGTKKMLVFDDMAPTEKVLVYDKGFAVPEGALAWNEDLTLRFGEISAPYVPVREPLAAELEHFVTCVSDGSAPRAHGRDGLAVVRVLEAVGESVALGGTPVSVVREA